MRWIWSVLLVASVAEAKPGVLASGGGRTVELAAGGAVTVVHGKDALALPDIETGDGTKVTATIVTPFLGHKGLLDVDVATLWTDNHHSRSRHHHFLIDTSQAQDAMACRFDGDSADTGEYASSHTAVTVKLLKQQPFQFELTLRTDARSTQPQPAKSDSSTRTETRELGAASCNAGAAPAKPRPAGAAPAIELADAVAAARAYAQAHHLDLSKQYLKTAAFDPVARSWDVEWQLPNAKGGNSIFHVPEAGAITVSHGE